MRKLLAILLCIVIFPAYAINGPQRAVILSGGLNWIINPTNKPDIMLDFANNRSWTKSTGVVSPASSLLTVSRASTGTVNDAAGNWTSVNVNLPRLSNQGLLVEEARTNSIRNNSMVGAVVMADGVELTTNGNFAAQGSGWTVGTAGGGSVVFGVGSVAITGDGTTFNNYISQQINGLVSGRSYVVTELAGTSGAGLVMSVGTTAGGVDIVANTATTVNGGGSPNPDRIAFTAPVGGSVWVSFKRQPASAITVNQVSVQDGERVQNGGFTANPLNAAQNTVQNGWQWTNNAGTGTVTYVGGNSVSLLGDGTHPAQIDVAIPTVAGFTYTISLDVSGTAVQVQAGNTAYNAALLSVASGIATGQKFQFTATASTTHINLAKSASATTTIANVSVQSAGALPTNWITTNSTGLPYSVQAVGTENGINYADVNLAGTASSGSLLLFVDATTATSAVYGQTWTASVFVRPNNAFTNFTSADFRVQEDGGTTPFTATSIIASSTSAGLGSQRVSATQTLGQSATSHTYALFRLVPNGAVNTTIRIGWPQLENNSFINSTVASAATAASGTTGVNGSAVYSVGGGTGTAATLNVTWAAGVMTVNSVASAGSYTVFPPSPAALTYVSGTATGWTGATVTLTPTDNSAKAFATSPIVTTSSAATRAVDNVSLSSPPTFGSAYTLFAQATPQAVNGNNQFLISANDGSSANRLGIFRAGSAGGSALVNTVGGVGASTSGTNWAQNASGKYAATTQASDQAGSFNGGTIVTLSGALPIGVNSVSIGSQTSISAWNGFVSQAALWASQRVPNAQLQSMTQ